MEVQERGEISLHGFVSKPQEQRASRDSQYLFVNGRFVKDRVLTKAISDAYKNVIPPGSYPVVMLMIDIPSEEVDVNVHPAKTEVRFRRPYVVSESVALAIRSAFSKTKPFANFPIKESYSTTTSEIKTPEILQNKPLTRPAPATPEIEIAPTNSTIFDLPDVDDPFEIATKTINKAQFDLDFTSESEKQQEFSKTNNIEVKKAEIATPTLKDSNNLLEMLASTTCNYQISQTEELPNTKAVKILGQLHNSYIVAIDKEGLLLIDQHVAHERILFEIHLSRILEHNLEVQEMLIPETMDLSPAQYSAFEMLETEFETSGFDLMPLSGRTIAIKAVPAVLSSSNARKLILELLSTVEKERRNISLEYFQREIAASIACHAAIKVNMSLTVEKMHWLIDELMKTECPTNCPHGRPIILRFSMRDIEKGFKRI